MICYDLETLKNFFSATFVDMKTGVVSSFIVHESRNDLEQLRGFLRGVKKMVGFNNISFDYPVLHIILMGELNGLDGDTAARRLYKRAQSVIKEEWKRDYRKPLIDQRDLYRIWHFNNKARSTSLKYLQINMGWKNAQEMPIAHNKEVTVGQIKDILDYNLNDVLSTIHFYHITKDKIRMRASLGKKYGDDFGNASDTKIGERIFLLEMSKRTGISEKALSSRRTNRRNIIIKDCIIGGIEFQSPQFKGILERFMGMIIQNTRKSEPIFTVLDGVKYEFGFGGLHALRDNGIYRNVRSADVASYYPNLAISYRFFPHHLGEVFCDVYQTLYEERKKFKKGSDESDAIKLALNGVYGMSNAEWSPFYDPKYTMAVTINGQLLLALLCEQITLAGAGSIIMANTDGIEVDVRDEVSFARICEQWQFDTKLQLEFSDYKTIGIRDVNNYIGVKTNGSIKEKGAYLCEREIYKDQSMKIVTHAVREYFMNETSVEDTITQCRDITMFLMGARAKTGNLEYRRGNTGSLVVEKLPKNVRYYVSHSGGSIVKLLKNNSKKKKELVVENQLFDLPKIKDVDEYRIVNIHAGYSTTLFNKWVDKDFEYYAVNKLFYIREAKKLIDAIVKNQTTF